MSSNYENPSRISAFCDGGGSQESGFSLAYVMYTEDGILLRRHGKKIEYLPIKAPQKIYSSNQAEYMAVIELLLNIVELRYRAKRSFDTISLLGTIMDASSVRVNIFMDSQLVVRQINKQYKTNDVILKQLLCFIGDTTILLDNNNVSVRFYWVPRESNKVADKLQKEAINAKDG